MLKFFSLKHFLELLIFKNDIFTFVQFGKILSNSLTFKIIYAAKLIFNRLHITSTEK